MKKIFEPAAFGRLCVETVMRTRGIVPMTPAAFGRLCVETSISIISTIIMVASRLRAAVC